MSERIGGVFPGGPRRVGDGGLEAPHIRTVAERTRSVDRLRRRRTRERRVRRLIMGGLAALVAAGVLGYAAGRGARRPPTATTPERERASSLDQMISKEVNRTLLELWKMEDLERMPSPGGRR